MSIILDNIKTLCGIEAFEEAYDAEVLLLINSAVGRMKMAGVNDAVLGLDSDGKVITVGEYRVGKYKVGELIPTADTNERVLEFIATHVKIGLNQDANSTYYSIMRERESELLTTMYYAQMTDE